MSHRLNAILKARLVKLRIFSIIVLFGYVVYRLKTSYMDKPAARNPLNFSLLSTSPEFVFKTNHFT